MVLSHCCHSETTSQKFSSALFQSNRPELLFVLLVSHRKDPHRGRFGALLMFFSGSVDTLVTFCPAGEKQALCCSDKEAAMNEFHAYH